MAISEACKFEIQKIMIRSAIRLSLEMVNSITLPITAEENKEGMRIFKQMRQEAMQSAMRG